MMFVILIKFPFLDMNFFLRYIVYVGVLEQSGFHRIYHSGQTKVKQTYIIIIMAPMMLMIHCCYFDTEFYNVWNERKRDRIEKKKSFKFLKNFQIIFLLTTDSDSELFINILLFDDLEFSIFFLFSFLLFLTFKHLTI